MDLHRSQHIPHQQFYRPARAINARLRFQFYQYAHRTTHSIPATGANADARSQHRCVCRFVFFGSTVTPGRWFSYHGLDAHPAVRAVRWLLPLDSSYAGLDALPDDSTDSDLIRIHCATGLVQLRYSWTIHDLPVGFRTLARLLQRCVLTPPCWCLAQDATHTHALRCLPDDERVRFRLLIHAPQHVAGPWVRGILVVAATKRPSAARFVDCLTLRGCRWTWRRLRFDAAAAWLYLPTFVLTDMQFWIAGLLRFNCLPPGVNSVARCRGYTWITFILVKP